MSLNEYAERSPPNSHTLPSWYTLECEYRGGGGAPTVSTFSHMRRFHATCTASVGAPAVMPECSSTATSSQNAIEPPACCLPRAPYPLDSSTLSSATGLASSFTTAPSMLVRVLVPSDSISKRCHRVSRGADSTQSQGCPVQ
eukprot:9122268-Pyramimonas_sp.AAC.1